MDDKVTSKGNCHKISSILFVTLLFISCQLWADITYTVDNRRVESSGGDDYGSYSNVYYPDAPFADWSRPGQTSSLTTSGFSASGSGDAYSDYDWSSSWSFFDVSFNLSTNSQIDLTGNLWGEDFNYGSGDASITLYDASGAIVYSNSVAASYGFEESTILYSVVLAAGDYRIVAKAVPYFQIAYSSYTLNATVAASTLPPGPLPEPEPSTIGVFELYDSVGGVIPTSDTGDAVTSDVRDINNGTWLLSSTDAFFGVQWNAHDGVIYNTPGIYEIDTLAGGIYTIYLADGYTMGHILFDWDGNLDIDVINIWDANGNSIDVDGDGISGIAMIEGPFAGLNATFSIGGGASLEINPALQAIDVDMDGYTISTDCNDNNASIYPGAPEIANDGIDQDCDGFDLITDLDQDGFNAPQDCNDNDASIYPGAIEIKQDGIDQDCNGYDLTINITKAVAKAKGGSLSVTATSSLGAAAALNVDGYGAMSYNKRKNQWTLAVRKLSALPASITVSGIEGSDTVQTTSK